MAKKKKELTVQDTVISWQVIDDEDYISLTDMTRGFDGEAGEYIRNWLRTGATIEFLGIWEQVHNPEFNLVGFHQIKNQFTENTFLMSVKKWITLTGAIGITAKAGRYGGTYAHSDIATFFASWLGPTFYVYLVKEFKRLKEAEMNQHQLEWNANRFLTKRNYALQTEAIKRNLLPQSTEPPEREWLEYAGEADILNMALFGTTAKVWRSKHPQEAKKGENIRDHASNIQLIVLSNLEALNAEWICETERYERLRQAAAFQLGIFYRDQGLIE